MLLSGSELECAPTGRIGLGAERCRNSVSLSIAGELCLDRATRLRVMWSPRSCPDSSFFRDLHPKTLEKVEEMIGMPFNQVHEFLPLCTGQPFAVAPKDSCGTEDARHWLPHLLCKLGDLPVLSLRQLDGRSPQIHLGDHRRRKILKYLDIRLIPSSRLGINGTQGADRLPAR